MLVLSPDLENGKILQKEELSGLYRAPSPGM